MSIEPFLKPNSYLIYIPFQYKTRRKLASYNCLLNKTETFTYALLKHYGSTAIEKQLSLRENRFEF